MSQRYKPELKKKIDRLHMGNKRKKFILIFFILICLQIIIGVVLFKEREAITAEKFKLIMQNRGFNVKSQLNSTQNNMKIYYVGEEKDIEYYVFYELPNTKESKKVFNSIKIFLKKRYKYSSKSYISIPRKYILKINSGTSDYFTIIRVKNTVVFFKGPYERKEYIKNLVKEIGY